MSAISGKSDGDSEVVDILRRHKTRRREARASTKDGLVFLGYQGKGIQDILAPCVWTYQSQTAE